MYRFVLMPNHNHVICLPPSLLRVQVQDGHEIAKVQQSFLKYITQQMKFTLANADIEELEKYKVKAIDRTYRF